ncbi:MAG: hypothetical protein ACKVPX_06935 [Myxococcaceae bacterium]
MGEWVPEPDPTVNVAKLPLTAEEGFVWSRVDGRTPSRQLAAVTGLPPERLAGVLQRLVELGAILGKPAAGVETPAPLEPLNQDAPPEPLGELVAETGDAALTRDEKNSQEPSEDVPEAESDSDTPIHRARFESLFREKTADEREKLARAAEEPDLSAFCFDPLPAVVKAVLENTRTGLTHARLIARHHRSPLGLDAIMGRAAFVQDLGVRRWLIRNPQISQTSLRRLLIGRRPMESYKVAIDRDVPEQGRRTAREVLRTRFAQGTPEERVELIVATEGRALTLLVGVPLDARSTAILCGKSAYSTMLVQNLARWSATPPPLIGHLLRLETVRRQPSLKQMLLRHPNAPSGQR